MLARTQVSNLRGTILLARQILQPTFGRRLYGKQFKIIVKRRIFYACADAGIQPSGHYFTRKTNLATNLR